LVVFVRALDASARRRPHSNSSLARPFKTDDRGTYRIPGLPAGQYLVGTFVRADVAASDMSPAALAGMTGDQTTRRPSRTGVDLPRAKTQRLVWMPPIGSSSARSHTPPAPANGRTQAYPIAFYPNRPHDRQRAGHHPR
jgi:hypothetical protein